MKSGYKFYLITGSLVAMLLILLGMKYPAPLYSPGEVTEKHEKLRCRDCHAPFKGVPSESCSVPDCHAGEIGRKGAVKDLHGRVKGMDCLKCHTDHKGFSGKISISFDHKAFTGKAGCVDCHETDGIKAHRDRYGNRCGTCHGTKDWKKVTFSHDQVKRETCAECHRAPVDELHRKAFRDCKGCHGTKAWKPSTYNHEDYFYLDRTHDVTCSKCHDRNTYSAYNCMNCHEHATRGIIAEHREEGIGGEIGDCLRCHRVYMGGRSYGTDSSGEGMGGEEDEHEGRYESERYYRGGDEYRRRYFFGEYEDDDD